ncbi:MAG: MAPEG family protein [Kofleriaceae bacterium]
MVIAETFARDPDYDSLNCEAEPDHRTALGTHVRAALCHDARMEYVPWVALLWAFALIYIPRMGAVAAGMKAQPGGYDNSDPRAQQAQLTGAAKRAVAAHNNGIEAFPPFAVGVFAAVGRAHDKTTLIALICIIFMIARTAYIWAYINDKPSLRSSLWSLGLLCTTALLVLGIIGPKL